MKDVVILLVEDNPDDEALTLHAMHKNRLTNPVVVAHDGVEALDYLFATGAAVLNMKNQSQEIEDRDRQM